MAWEAIIIQGRGGYACVPQGDVPKDALSLALLMAQSADPEMFDAWYVSASPEGLRVSMEMSVNRMLRVIQGVKPLRGLFNDDGTTQVPIPQVRAISR